jgi:PAS domain S-box-containing protein
VTVRAVPVGESDLFAVAFESAALPAPARPPGEAADALGAELQKTQEQLQLSLEEFETSREELKAQNEELQSVNEELRSTAEELETAKEEAQSMAEELQTANDELKAKVDALAEATGDLENLVVSTEIATLFLDRELRIKWFTPHVRRHFRIRDSDLGRPLADLAPRFGGGPLVEDAEAVLDRLQVTEREVRGDDGRWYLVHVRPYRSVTDRIEGVVVTFVDITERRGGEEALHESEEQFRALVTASAEIVWTADAEGRLVEDSPTWRAFTGQTYDEWKGEGGFDVVHPDDRDEARAAYGAAVEAGERFEHDLRLWHTATRTWRWTHVRAVPLRDDAGAVRGYVGMNTDVTERRVAEETLRQSEARARFRAALAERFRALTDPAEVQRAAAQALGEHLGASRAHYAEVEPDGEHAVVVCDYARGVPDRAGRHALADFLTLHDEARAGRTFVVADVQAEDGLSPEEKAVFAGLPVAALVVAPVVRRARFVAALAVHHAAPHAWSPAEVALVEETAERTWEAVERTRAEAALRESEARYRTLFASMTEGFCVLEMVYDEAGRAVDYRFVEANPAFERHTGLEDPVGRTARDLIPGLEDHWVETYARVAETGEPERFEQGSAAMGRLFEVEAFRVGGEGGRVGLLFADVTERAAAADALRQSEERFRQAVDAAGLGTWSYDVGEELTHFDARAREIFGVGAEALPSDAVVALVHPDDLAAFAAARDRALAPDTPDTFAETHRVVRPDGEVRWVRGQARAFFEGEGPGRRPVRAVGVVLDVTEQRAGEAALRESEERFRRTAETVPDVLFIAAGDGRLRYVNPRFEEVTGVPAEDAVGADLWAEIVHPEDRAPAGPGGAAPGPYELRHRLRTADGSYRWHLTRAQPVLDAGGRVEAWYGTSTDIDRMVRAEEEVQSLNATLERRVRQRTALARRLLARLTTAEEEERKRIAQVLHDDLQQRLYGLSMTLALVRRQSDAGAPDPAVLDRAEATLAEAAALTRTLSTELAPAVLNAADLDETLEWLAEHARAQYGLDVEVAVAPGSGVADRDARVVLYQILRELLFNVVKHAGTGRARVRVRPADDAVAVTVEDEGVGFDPAVLDDAAGTGLGLASAQGRLDLVGGRVRVDAAPGRGTRVTVWVPRRVYASEEP